MKKKQIRSMLLVMIAVAMMMCAVGSTMAWLQDSTKPVTNTFTPSHVKVDLTETTGENYPMVPGHVITKDPKVTVKADSEKCYVFLRVTETGVGNYSFDEFISYKLDTAWEIVPEQTNVYYQIIDKQNSDKDLPVLVEGEYEGELAAYVDGWGNNQVLVNPTVTETMMEALATNKPTLKFEAFAIQYMSSLNDHFTPAKAWELASQN